MLSLVLRSFSSALSPFRLPHGSVSALAAASLLFAGAAQSITTPTLESDFESPVFTLGNIADDPNVTGQGGWGGWNSVIIDGQLVRAQISDAQAHSGTQSLKTTHDTRVISKALDASAGEYPFALQPFSIHSSVDWWVQAWVRIEQGGSALMTLYSGLGGCPLIQIDSAGVPYPNTCLTHDPGQTSLGSGAFEQWLLLEMVHVASAPLDVNFKVTGPGISRTMTLSPYSGPGSGAPAYLGLSGDAYWDDVRAGYGTAPVPEPGTALLVAAGLLGLGLGRSRVS